MKNHCYLSKYFLKIKAFFSKKSPGQPDGWYWNLLPLILNKISLPLINLWGRTLKYRVYGQEHVINTRKKGGMLMCTWHGNMSPQVFYMRDKGVAALVSPHWIGEIIASVVKTLGFIFIRASSGYNAKEGLRAILASLKNGDAIAIMLDGPDGPAKKVNAGVVQMAALSGKPIIVSFGAGSKYYQFDSWDKNEWPLPFSTIEMRFSEAIYIPRKSTKKEMEEYKTLLETKLYELEKEVRTSLSNNH